MTTMLTIQQRFGQFSKQLAKGSHWRLFWWYFSLILTGHSSSKMGIMSCEHSLFHNISITLCQFMIFGHFCSRLAALKSDFATAFSDADQVLVTEVWMSWSTIFSVSSGKGLLMIWFDFRFMPPEKLMFGMSAERIWLLLSLGHHLSTSLPWYTQIQFSNFWKLIDIWRC